MSWLADAISPASAASFLYITFTVDLQTRPYSDFVIPSLQLRQSTKALHMPSERTNLGPLTTRWKYPDRCTVPVTACSNCDNGWIAQTCGDNDSNSQGVLDDPECWPPRSKSMSHSNALNGWGFYSPAFDCPQGYTAACHATGTDASFNFQFSINDRETVKGCCPTGYACAGGGTNAQTCTSTAFRGSLQVASCSDRKTVLNSLSLPFVVSVTTSGETTVQTIDALTFYAPMFQLNHHEKDITLSTTGSQQTQTTASSTSTAESSTDGSSSGGLSTGAQAGIGAGVGVAGLMILGAAFYLWRRRKRATPASELAAPEEQKKSPTTPAGYSPAPQYAPVELDAASTRHEMS
ncbi:hypothetical protein F53441_11428 [Fusarium austroafricanum]|uniref:Uncharacterized protein n=1 Tax=Fusarium austroafricanum TaxID=2364996 RepID=A0A8H4K2C1_9HYPO|nr:hypothetical protein F53441_11428 [Fusarium austroafricanum]